VNLTTGKVVLISDNATSAAAGGQELLGDDYGVAQEPSGDFVVIVRRGTNDAKNPEPSRVVRIAAKTGAQSLINGSPDLHYNLVSLATSPNGTIYVGDEAVADPQFNAGVVYRVTKSKLEVVAGNSKSAAAGGTHHIDAPMGLAFESDSKMFILGDTSGVDDPPDDAAEYHGGVTAIDLATGKGTLLGSNFQSKQAGGQSLFGDPRAFVRAPNGDFFIVDDLAINDAKYNGDIAKIIRVDGRTGAQSLVSDNARAKAAGGEALFKLPYGIAMTTDGSLIVVDGDRLLRVDPSTGRQTLVAQGLGSGLGVIIAR
jgi:sugar lactone lactonase YvrE